MAIKAPERRTCVVLFSSGTHGKALRDDPRATFTCCAAEREFHEASLGGSSAGNDHKCNPVVASRAATIDQRARTHSHIYRASRTIIRYPGVSFNTPRCEWPRLLLWVKLRRSRFLISGSHNLICISRCTDSGYFVGKRCRFESKREGGREVDPGERAALHVEHGRLSARRGAVGCGAPAHVRRPHGRAFGVIPLLEAGRSADWPF
jgi:hypothetical protein